MISIGARCGLVGLVVALVCMPMACAVAPSGPGKVKPKGKAPKELTEGKAPRSEFGGLEGNAYHVVYLIDRSGSMFDTFEAVKDRIADSVKDLRPTQDFHVIMFSDGSPLEKKPMILTPPTDKCKLALARFLETVKCEGTTNPINAINRAFDVLARANRRPGKIIYLLTDGAFPDPEAVIAAIRARNAKRDVTINTFLYGWKPPIAEKVMTQVATENGGRYRYIKPDE